MTRSGLSWRQSTPIRRIKKCNSKPITLLKKKEEILYQNTGELKDIQARMRSSIESDWNWIKISNTDRI